jgi:hypothetical protein
VENRGSLKFPRRPFAAPLTLLRPRKIRIQLALTPDPTRPGVRQRPWLLRWETFEAQSRGLTACCLRFKAPSHPGAMQDSLLTCAATLWWAGFAPAGSAVKGFSYMSVSHTFSFREFTLTQYPDFRGRIRIVENGDDLHRDTGLWPVLVSMLLANRAIRKFQSRMHGLEARVTKALVNPRKIGHALLRRCGTLLHPETVKPAMSSPG